MGGDVSDLSVPEADVRYLVDATADALARPIEARDVVAHRRQPQVARAAGSDACGTAS